VRTMLWHSNCSAYRIAVTSDLYGHTGYKLGISLAFGKYTVLSTVAFLRRYVLPPSNTATLLIILNLLTILMSTLILHLSFFGRLLALYKRNLNRVECLSKILSTTLKEQLDSWWSCRNFVLNDDLSLDYDIGGLAVSATFLIAITLFAALISQVRD
jgi:hypothetical protein